MKYAMSMFAAGMTASFAMASGSPVPVIVIPQPLMKLLKEQAKATPQDDEEEEMDPAKLADRIATNGKNATERLAMNDPGRDTQTIQKQILKDLDKLLNQPPPPPMGGDGGPPPPPMGGDQPPPPMGGQKPMGGQPPMGGQKPMGGQQPMGGQKPMGGQPMPMGGQPMPMGGQPMPMGGQPMPMGGQPMPMGQKDAQGKAGGDKPGIAGATTPTTPPPLTAEDRVTKEVWGHLPPQLRQKMNQYYQEQFMPRYAELLKQYYSELAEREREKKK